MLRETLESAIEMLASKVGAYVSSFTDDAAALVGTEQKPGDRLNQWRAYSLPGKGFSLGFDPRLIDQQLKGELRKGLSRPASLHQCVYDRYKKHSLLKETGGSVVEEMHQALVDVALWLFKLWRERWPSPTAEGPVESQMREIMSSTKMPKELGDPTRRAAMAVVAALTIDAPTLKNEAFFEEKEWRIVVLGVRPSSARLAVPEAEDVKFRSGPLGVTPYIDLPLLLHTDRSPLRKIVVGPTPHMDDAIQSTKMLLDQLRIRQKADDYPDGVEVVPSQIPFRYW